MKVKFNNQSYYFDFSNNTDFFKKIFNCLNIDKKINLY